MRNNISILVDIIDRFGKLDECSDDVTAEAKEGDNIVVHVDSLYMLDKSLEYLYEHFKKMSLFEGSDLVQISDGYYEIMSYVTTYFSVQSMDPTKL